MDTSEESIAGQSSSEKRRALEASLYSLFEKIKGNATKNTKIILISVTVYNVCADRLKSEGFKVINNTPLRFPIGNYQKEFINKVSELIAM